MPGSIRVSVLEASDLPQIIAESEGVTIKVVVGTREYQTAPGKAVGGKTAPWNLDFVFPVLNLRDNLLVILLDEYGEAISKSEINTPSIVEQGSFDTNLSLNGGGNVHLSLTFVLTEEERRRIDVMRATALKRREDEALKLSASSQLGPVQGETKPSSYELRSTLVEGLEKDSETAGVAKDPYATPPQEGDASQFSPVLQATHDKSSTVKDEDSGDQKCVDLDKSDLPQSPSEENKELVEDLLKANLKPTSSSVKAKIKAIEKTRPQGTTNQNHILSPNSKIQKFSPHSKTSPRRKVEEAEQGTKVNEPLDDLQTAHRMDIVEPTTSVLVGNMASLKTSESGNTSKEEECLLEKSMSRPEDDGLESNGRNVTEKRTSTAAQKRSLSDESAQSVDTKDVQFNKLEYEAIEAEQQTKSSSMIKRKNINLVVLAKEVLSGVISGAVLIAAVALLWAANPKKRNSHLHQRSKQRKRK